MDTLIDKCISELDAKLAKTAEHSGETILQMVTLVHEHTTEILRTAKLIFNAACAGQPIVLHYYGIKEFDQRWKTIVSWPGVQPSGLGNVDFFSELLGNLMYNATIHCRLTTKARCVDVETTSPDESEWCLDFSEAKALLPDGTECRLSDCAEVWECDDKSMELWYTRLEKERQQPSFPKKSYKEHGQDVVEWRTDKVAIFCVPVGDVVPNMDVVVKTIVKHSSSFIEELKANLQSRLSTVMSM